MLSYNESRRWLWTRIVADDREVINALWFHGRKAPAGVKLLPRRLNPMAVRRALAWLRQQVLDEADRKIEAELGQKG